MTHPLDTPLHAHMASTAADRAEALDNYGAFFESTLRDISYRPNYHIDSGTDGVRWWIEIVHERHDAITGVWGQGRGGKRYIHYGTSRSDIVRTVFGAFLSYEEHDVREFFRYSGQQVFGPHMDIVALATWLRETQ